MDNEIINLYKMMINPRYNSYDIINYIDNNSINVNTFLPAFNEDGELPLIYLCVSRPDLEELFKFMVKHDVNIPDERFPVDILIYSDIKYLKYLSLKNCKLNPKTVELNIYNMLLKGNIKKVLTFIKLSLVDKNVIKNLIDNHTILFDILDSLYEKLFNICRDSSDDVIQVINELVSYYTDTFKFFFNNGVPTNITDDHGNVLAQNILNTYNLELIKLLVLYKTDFTNLTFYHHSNFCQDNKSIMTPIYNNENFKIITQYLSPHIRPRKFKIIKSK